MTILTGINVASHTISDDEPSLHNMPPDVSIAAMKEPAPNTLDFTRSLIAFDEPRDMLAFGVIVATHLPPVLEQTLGAGLS